jgi:hypothetical protein
MGGARQMPDEMSSLSAIEAILKEQLVEMRAMRALLESMDKKLDAVYEITEEKASSFARTDQTP